MSQRLSQWTMQLLEKVRNDRASDECTVCFSFCLHCTLYYCWNANAIMFRATGTIVSGKRLCYWRHLSVFSIWCITIVRRVTAACCPWIRFPCSMHYTSFLAYWRMWVLKFPVYKMRLRVGLDGWFTYWHLLCSCLPYIYSFLLFVTYFVFEPYMNMQFRRYQIKMVFALRCRETIRACSREGATSSTVSAYKTDTWCTTTARYNL
jgi:hypothetical protein